MFVVWTENQKTVDGKCCPHPLSLLINYLADSSWEGVIGLLSPTNSFRGDAHATRAAA